MDQELISNRCASGVTGRYFILKAMNSKKEVTIYDIARELDVSPTTVSRALKDHFSIGKETTKAVKKCAKELGYQPNIIASNLRRNKTNTIGVIIPWINSPFLSSMVSGIEEVANQAGFNVIISQSCDSYEKEVANTNTLLANRVDGLIVSLAMETERFDHFNSFQRKNIPVIFVDRITKAIETDRVVIDNFAAGFKATEHLIEQGCTRIAHFAGSQSRNIYKDRQEGYIEALKKNNLPVDEDLIVYSNLSLADGTDSAKQVLTMSHPPDGIFSANDMAAVSTIKFAKESGIQIPDDLCVVGFNNDPISSIIDPPLTTIIHPAFDMGRVAAQQTLKQKDVNSIDVVQSETILLKTKLLVRQSSLRKITELPD